MLTKRQKQALDFIKSYTQKRGVAPSLEEIKDHLGLSSVSTAHHHVQALKDQGYLGREDNQPRAINVFEQEQMIQIPLSGTIAAGRPIEAIEQKELIAVPKSSLTKGKDFFALRVAGDSMEDENIDDGDIVIVHKQDYADNGQKVVALIDNTEATLKKLVKEKSRIFLQPANSKYEPIPVTASSLNIQGVVIDVIKSAPEEKIESPRQYKQEVKKYRQLPLNKILIGDAVEELKKIPDRSVDLIILDPPYWKVINEHWDYNWRTRSDYAQWCFEWFKELSRIVKLSGSLYLFGYMRNLFYLYKDIVELGFSFRQQIIVDKGIKSVSGRATKGYKMFPNVTESLLFFIFDSKPFIKDYLKKRQTELSLSSLDINKKLGVKINGGGVWSLYTGENILAQVPTREMWERLQRVLKFDMPYEDIGQTFNIEMGLTDVWSDIDFYKEERLHPTQKPVKLIERIIRASTNKGMIVLDPFFGSGATGVAAINLKRNYIGIELDKKYVQKAQHRIDRLGKTQKLFN